MLVSNVGLGEDRERICSPDQTHKDLYENIKDSEAMTTPISFSHFTKCRPAQVRLMWQSQLRQCLCEYCTNIELKTLAVNGIAAHRDFNVLSLVSQFTQNKTLLQSKHSSTVRNQKKAKVWGNITTALNATGTVPRTVDNVEKKWLELKRNGVAFSSARKRPKTGDGPPPEEPWYVE